MFDPSTWLETSYSQYLEPGFSVNSNTIIENKERKLDKTIKENKRAIKERKKM
jgi:hypothetical protein